MTSNPLQSFHPLVAQWFRTTFRQPTPPQAQGWPEIASGKNVLLLAPTGSGKTLAAFLKCLDWLYQQTLAGQDIDGGVRIVYISPLKALNNDMYHNLQVPLAGIAQRAAEQGIPFPQLRAAVRTGDTPAKERQRMMRKPPHLLITTPESLYLLLSSKARNMLQTARFVIVDEIHTLFPNKRGAHLAISLERLQRLVGSSHPLQRIGLSATMKPLTEISHYLGGFETTTGRWRPVTIVNTKQRRAVDLQVILPTPDMQNTPDKTIWPSVYRTLTDLIKAHRTTLVFVNNRRLAERITAELNTMNEFEIARTHHGSLSRETRLASERMLKQGDIPCMVATTSLELGIDIGHIDLVVQVESPKEIARGIQRVGRSGHLVGQVSKGRIIPKTAMDLIESLVVLKEMKEGNIEPARAPRDCLDVLSQQLVALATEKPWQRPDMYQLVRGAYNFSSLSEERFGKVLAMLTGDYDSDMYVDLRPRLRVDPQSGAIEIDPYGRRLVYANSGTIPDRGYFQVVLADGQTKVGELDEEFVFERRLNERFLLGTSTWRIREIRQDRVVVVPARRGSANIPFWKGEPLGRSLELGVKIGEFMRMAEDRLDSPTFTQWLAEHYQAGHLEAQSVQRTLRNQKTAIRSLPTDKRLVVEEFLDEVGQWRVLLHSFFGHKLHWLLGLLIKHDWERQYGHSIELVCNDDGILLHCPPGVEPLEIHWERLASGIRDQTIPSLLTKTALFGLTFRHCAQRALVLSLGGHRRIPLWLSRLKAGNLLQTVSHRSDFPLIQETYREILEDYFDLSELDMVVDQICRRQILVHRVRRASPSPLAHSHLFQAVSAFMYADDTPKEKVGAQKQRSQEAAPDIPSQDMATFLRFLYNWQRVGQQVADSERLGEILDQLQHYFAPALAWENGILDARLAKYQPTLLDQLLASGQFVWRARGLPPHTKLSFEVYQSSVANHTNERQTLSVLARQVLTVLQTEGALPFLQILRSTNLSSVEVWDGLQELILHGVVTNDSFAPIRHLLGSGKSGQKLDGRILLRSSVLLQMGRFSVLPPATLGAEQQVEILLKRYGVVCYDLKEDFTWSDLQRTLEQMEIRGTVHRGYYIQGFSGVQFATSQSLSRLVDTTGSALVYALYASDPACPGVNYGDVMVFENGVPVLAASGSNVKIRAMAGTPRKVHLEKLLALLHKQAPQRRTIITHYNGQPVLSSPICDDLRMLGCENDFQRMILWPSHRSDPVIGQT